VLRFISHYRALAVEVSRVQWHQFFEVGNTNKYATAKHLNEICGAAPVQKASYQVQEQIDSWLSSRANVFVDYVRSSSPPEATRKQLYATNQPKAWFSREAIDDIAPEARALAWSIMCHCMNGYRRSDLSRISPRLDSRVATIEKTNRATFAKRWVRLKLPNRGAITLPLKRGEKCAGGTRVSAVHSKAISPT
jgi:hypothetical protein